MNTILHLKRNTILFIFVFITTSGFAQMGCWKSVATSVTHSLAIKNDGTLWAWGLNDTGQLGDGTLIDKQAPIQIGTDNNWKEISTGQSHSLAIKNNGTLWAWGDNYLGELGNNSDINSSIPIQITSNTNWKSISAGSFYSIALKNDGTIWSWGSNEVGQLGLGNLVDKLTPTQVAVGTFWKSISAGSGHTVVLKNDNTIWGFGKNTLGSLGLGNNNNTYLTPTQIGTSNNWKKISVSKDYFNFYPFSVGIKNDGTIWSTGNNANGQIGNGTNTNNVYSFTQIGTQNDWGDVEAGASHSVALKNSGNIYCWGSNNEGQIGDGTNTDRFSPTLVSNVQSIQKIYCGFNKTCILNSTGTYYGFGSNVYGDLGTGNTTNSNIPISISCPISSITNVSYTPTLFLSNSTTQLGQSIIFTGNNYTPNGEVKINFYGAGGMYIITANADGFGNVTHLYTNPIGAIIGEVAVRIYDKTTTKYSPIKTLTLTSATAIASYLSVTSPANGFKTPISQIVNITWKDKMVAIFNGFSYPIESGTAQRQYDYTVEYRDNDSNPWIPINGNAQVTGYATLNEYVNFQTNAVFSTTSTNYTIRVKDNLNNLIIAQSAIFEVTPTASVSLEWDKSMNTNPTHKPIGVVADGISRIFIKVTPTTGTLSYVDVSLNNNSDTTVNLLGKIMPATAITNFSNEADNATLTSITNATIVNNSAWIWYVAPEDFKGNNPNDLQTNKRTVNASVVIHKTDGSTENVTIPIIIKRPQILFAHGLMGDEHTFDNFKLNGVTPFESLFYESTKVRMMPGASFENNAKALLGLRGGSTRSFQWFLNEDRKNGFASCQIDYVGHSMGGCIARAAEMQPEFRHPRFTYGKGYIHKLVTLGTPHNSSPIADVVKAGINKFNDALSNNINLSVIAAAGSLFDFGKLYQDDPNNKWFSIVRPRVNTDPNIATTINNWYNIFGIINTEPLINYDLSPTPAIYDLAIQGGVNFPLTPIKTHFIVGDLYPGYQALPILPSFDEAFIEQLSMIQDLVGKTGWIFDLIETCNTDPFVKSALDEIKNEVIEPELKKMKIAMKIIDFYNALVLTWNTVPFVFDSDGVVDIFSQSAGLPLTPGNSVTVFDYTAHTGAPNNVTTRPTVVDKVIELLNTNRTSVSFSAIPSNQSNNRLTSTPTTTFLDNLDFSKLQIEVDPTKMDIITPVNPQFIVDNIATIQVMLYDVTNFSEIELHVGKEVYSTSSIYNGIATFTFQVAGTFVGPLSIFARAKFNLPNGNTKFLYDSIKINIEPNQNATLTGLQINPEVIELWVGDKYKPVVNGIYPNYSSVVQATPIITGDIVSYDTNNKELTALNVGETQVVYNYGGFSKILYIIVRNNYETQCTQNGILLNSSNNSNLPCDLTISNVNNVSEIIWYKDNIVVSSSTNTLYSPSISGTYYAIITTTDGCNYTTSSINIGTLGINDFTNELENIKIYPNPTKDIINIEIENTEIQSITILDLSGRIIKSENKTANKTTINIQDLPSAIYLMQVKTKLGNKTVKVIKK